MEQVEAGQLAWTEALPWTAPQDGDGARETVRAPASAPRPRLRPRSRLRTANTPHAPPLAP